jgi:hypothetical protein
MQDFFKTIILSVMLLFSFLLLLPSYASEAKNRKTEKTPLSNRQTEKVELIQPPIEALPSIDPETSHATAKELIKEGKYKEALSLLSPFISEPMKYPTISSDYLVILVWDGSYDDAIGIYENLPSSFPRRAYLLRNVAKCFIS